MSHPNQPTDRISHPSIGLAGTVLGKWRLGRFLGEGEFGAVYEGSHTVIDGLRAAVKVLHPHKALDPATIRRFINEASAASHANHENIIRIYDGDAVPGGTCYLAMELLTGVILRQRLKAGPLDLQQTIRITTQIAEALDAAHRLNIIHRDLKPDNVHLGERSNRPDFVTLFDFGIARLRDAAEEGSHLRTRSGVIMGTPEYMSPEQWRGAADIDARADVYALGILLYECLAGKPPFSGNLYEVMRAHVENPVPPLPGTAPDIQAMSALVLAMLAKEREQRPANMRIVVDTLQRIAQGRLLPTRPSGPMPIAQPPVSAPDQPTLVGAQVPEALVALWRNSGTQPAVPPGRENTASQSPREPTSPQAAWRPSGPQVVTKPAELAQPLGGQTLPSGSNYAPTLTSAPDEERRKRLIIAVAAGSAVAAVVLAIVLWSSPKPSAALPDPPPAETVLAEAVAPSVEPAHPAKTAELEKQPAPPPDNPPPTTPTNAVDEDEEENLEDPAPGSTRGPSREGTSRPAPARGKLVLTITGGTPAQRGLIEQCVKINKQLPAEFEIKLRRSGTLYVNDGPRPSTFQGCLRMSFARLEAPEHVMIRRKRQ